MNSSQLRISLREYITVIIELCCNIKGLLSIIHMCVCNVEIKNTHTRTN